MSHNGFFPRESKTALVLAGGGLTGAVYEIGALRAIEDLLVDRTVNDFDIYIGTSAGAIVSAFLANGMSPKKMLQIVSGSHPHIDPVARKHLFHPNFQELRSRSVALPRKVVGAFSHYVRNLGDMTLFDLVWSMGEALPSGIYDNSMMESYLGSVLTSLPEYSNHFRDLSRELYIIATDLDTGDRAVFGEPGYEGATISQAVAASGALPILYRPVRIGNREYVDGGLRGTASIDLAIEHGAELVVCINPLVPFDNSKRDLIPFLGRNGGYLSEKGIQAVASQVLHIMMHSGLDYHVKQVRRSHPEVDIVLIEPRMDDYQMHFYNIMRYSAQMTIAQHGFESVTLDLAEDYPYYRDTMARHGIPLTRRLVIEELQKIQASNYDPEVLRRILSSRPTRLKRATPYQNLTQTLAELDVLLDAMAMEGETAKQGMASPG